MWPWRRAPDTLLHQASIRLLRALVVAILVIGLLMGWAIHLSQEKMAQREIQGAMEYFSDGVKDMEQRWEEAAIRHKSRLEFARILEDPANRWARLSSYLTTQNTGETFSAWLVADSHNRVLFSFGFDEEAVPAAFPSPPDIGWHYRERDATLYRFYVQPIWLGAEGMGHLILFRPMEHGLLHQFATPNTHLFLRWHGQVVASSLGEQGKTRHLPQQAGSMERDGMRVEQRSIQWGKAGPDSPELVIHRQIESLFEAREVILGILAGLAGLFAALWASIGVWVYRTTGRIAILGLASRQFIREGHPSPELERLLERACRPRADEINEVARSLGALADTVTERDAERDAYEATLRESEAKVLEITSVLADGVYVLDREGLVTFVNLETERLLGWTAAELLGRNGHETFHYKRPDGTPISSDSCPVHQTIHTGQSYRSPDDWLVRKDGSILPVSIVSSPILRDGVVTGSVAAFHDITQRLEAQKALRESEERFRLISTSAMDAIVIIGPAEEITYWNPAAERIFGHKADEALGRNLHHLIAPARHYEDAHRGFEHFRTSGQGAAIGKTFETTALRKDGEEFPIELSISAFTIKRQWHALGIIREVTERKKAEEQIHQLAYYDTLTHLPNRRLLLDRLNQSLVQAKRHQRSVAVMFLDLDRFKLINDTLGHDVGDELLKAVATRLNACVRSGDTVSRQGGDEFIIVLAEVAQPPDAALVAEKIIDALGQPISVNGHELQITTSIGIAIFPVNGTDDAQELMKKADKAMYAVKEAGRNGYRFYSPT